jgi:hypothetical protein
VTFSDDVQMSCVISGIEDLASQSIKWYHKNILIKNGSLFHIKNRQINGIFSYKQTTAIKSTLTVNYDDDIDCEKMSDLSGQYSCEVAGSKLSGNVTFYCKSNS